VSDKPQISIVSPVYQTEKIVTELVRQLHENLSIFSIWFVGGMILFVLGVLGLYYVLGMIFTL